MSPDPATKRPKNPAIQQTKSQSLVGLVRVSKTDQDTRRQRDALDPICVKVFEERVSGKLKVADRPGLQAALDYIRPGDLLTVQEVDRLGRNLLEGLLVLNDLFERGISVKVRDSGHYWCLNSGVFVDVAREGWC